MGKTLLASYSQASRKAIAHLLSRGGGSSWGSAPQEPQGTTAFTAAKLSAHEPNVDRTGRAPWAVATRGLSKQSSLGGRRVLHIVLRCQAINQSAAVPSILCLVLI